VIFNERGGREFCDNEKEDAERPDLRIAPHLPAYKIDYGFELSLSEGFIEVVR